MSFGEMFHGSSRGYWSDAEGRWIDPSRKDTPTLKQAKMRKSFIAEMQKELKSAETRYNTCLKKTRLREKHYACVNLMRRAKNQFNATAAHSWRGKEDKSFFADAMRFKEILGALEFCITQNCSYGLDRPVTRREAEKIIPAKALRELKAKYKDWK